MFEQFIGTKPVEERHRIDLRALESYLKFKIENIEQFKGGQSNPTYRITAADGRRFVLRRKPPGKLLPSAHAVDQDVAGFGSRAHGGDEPPHRVAAEEHSARDRNRRGARRLPPRQYDLSSRRAEDSRGARLGALDAGRSARGLRLSLHELAYP